VSVFPDEWLADVVVLRGGGRDPRGNPQPETQHPISGVLVGWRATSDPVDRSDQTADYAVLYDQTGNFQWKGTDRVRIPNDFPGPRGVWQVDGQPKPWPLGWEIPLRRA